MKEWEVHKVMDKDNRKIITAETLGKARRIVFFKNGKQVKISKAANEVFFSIEKLDSEGTYENSRRTYGYVTVTKEMSDIFNTLFQDQKSNMHLNIIEWNDSYNVIFCDGMYISQVMCRIEKEEFYKWESTIAEAE